MIVCLCPAAPQDRPPPPPTPPAPPSPPPHRTTGIGIFYYDNHNNDGVAPPVMYDLICRLRTVQQVVIMISVRVLPIPNISLEDSMLVRPLHGMPNFYTVIMRHGYQDPVSGNTPFYFCIYHYYCPFTFCVEYI